MVTTLAVGKIRRLACADLELVEVNFCRLPWAFLMKLVDVDQGFTSTSNQTRRDFTHERVRALRTTLASISKGTNVKSSVVDDAGHSYSSVSMKTRKEPWSTPRLVWALAEERVRRSKAVVWAGRTRVAVGLSSRARWTLRRDYCWIPNLPEVGRTYRSGSDWPTCSGPGRRYTSQFTNLLTIWGSGPRPRVTLEHESFHLKHTGTSVASSIPAIVSMHLQPL